MQRIRSTIAVLMALLLVGVGLGAGIPGALAEDPTTWYEYQGEEFTNETGNMTLGDSPTAQYTSLRPAEASELINVSALTPEELEDLLELPAPLTQPALPPVQGPIDLTAIDLGLVDVSQFTEVVPSAPEPTEAVEDVVNTITTVVDQLPATPFSHDTPSVVPIIDDLLPPILPNLEYVVCWEIVPATSSGCREGLFSVPTDVDFDHDAVPDVLVTVTPCGLACAQANIDRNPLEAARPAKVWISYDTDASSNGEFWIYVGYDTLRHGRNNPSTFHVTGAFTSTTDAWTLDTSLASSGASVPLTLVAGVQIASSGTFVESQRAEVTWTDVLPATTEYTLSVDNRNAQRRLDMTYAASAPAKASAVYRKDTAAGNKIEYHAASLESVPTEWALAVVTDANGRVDVDWTANAVVGKATYERASLENNAYKSVMKANLENVAKTVTVRKTSCRLYFNAETAMKINEFQAGVDHYLLIDKPNYAVVLGGGSSSNVAVKIPNLKTFDGTTDCHNNQGFSIASWTLSGRLDSMFVLLQKDGTVTRAEVTPANGLGFPSGGTVEYRNTAGTQQVKLYNTPEALGRLTFCHTTVGACYSSGVAEDNVLIYRVGAGQSITGQITGLRTADVGRGASSFTATATLNPGGQPFEAFYLSGNDWFQVSVSNLPASFTFTTDMSSTARVVTDRAITRVDGTGRFGSWNIVVVALGIPAGTDATFSKTSTRVALSSNTYIPQIVGCYTTLDSCSIYGASSALVVPGQTYSANLLDVKSVTADFPGGSYSGSAVTANRHPFYGRFVNGASVTEVVVCNLPGRLDASYTPGGSVKSVSYNGNGQGTDCVYAHGTENGALAFEIYATGVPSSFSASWDLTSSGRKLSFSSNAPVGFVYGTSALSTGNWRSVTACVEQLVTFDLTFAADLSDFNFQVANGQSLQSINFVLSSNPNTYCSAASAWDYAYYYDTGASKLLLGQVKGLKRVHGGLSETWTDVTVNLAASRPVQVFWQRGSKYAYVEMPSSPTSVRVQTNNADYVKWEADKVVADAYVIASNNGKEYYAAITGVPTYVEAKYDEANEKVVVDVNNAITTLTLWMLRPTGVRTIYVHATAVPDVTVDWGSEGKVGTVTVTGEVGSVDFAVDFTGAGFGLPGISGIHYVKQGALKYLSGNIDCLRFADWNVVTNVKATVDSCGGNGATPFHIFYVDGADWAEGYVTYLPRDRITVDTDLKSFVDLTTTRRVGDLLLYGSKSAHSFILNVRNFPSLSLDVDASARRVVLDTTGSIGGVYLYVQKTSGAGILDTGFKYLELDVLGIANDVTIAFDDSNGQYLADFGSTGVDRLVAWASKNGCWGGLYGVDYLWWDTSCGSDSFMVDIHGFKKARYNDATATKEGEIDTRGGRPFYFYRTVPGGKWTYAHVPYLPTSVDVWFTIGKTGNFTFKASQRIGGSGITAYSTELPGPQEYLYAHLSATPVRAEARWKIDNPGYVYFDASEQLTAEVCGVIGVAALCLGVSMKHLDTSWSFTDPGNFWLDTDQTWVSGWIDLRFGNVYDPSAAYIASGGIWANDFAVDWDFWHDLPVGNPFRLRLTAGTYLCLKIPVGSGYWFCVDA